jgi:hypothetical protein
MAEEMANQSTAEDRLIDRRTVLQAGAARASASSILPIPTAMSCASLGRSSAGEPGEPSGGPRLRTQAFGHCADVTDLSHVGAPDI